MAKQVRNELCDDKLSRASCTRVAPNIVVVLSRGPERSFIELDSWTEGSLKKSQVLLHFPPIVSLETLSL
jgi:hypothetical protein